MEIKNEVKSVQVDYRCPECKIGFLRPTGIVYSTYPPKFPHKCNNINCNYMETFTDKKYPYVEYVNVSEQEPELWVVKYGYPESDTVPSKSSIYFSTFALNAGEAKYKAFQNKRFLDLINFSKFNKEYICVYMPDDKEKENLKINDVVMY